ncbi:MAG: RNA pseudouridine synthase [Bacteroides sp.]|nr:RNA pseudouridine synthase [Bacteroides sp.]
MLHPLPNASAAPLPDKFTYPFCYTPHPLCVQAAAEVQQFLAQQTDWQAELSKGKMFGVLIVRADGNRIGFLAAFSGILAGTNVHPYFVPPVYDLLQPDGFFRQEEEVISGINRRIRELENDRNRTDLQLQLHDRQAAMQHSLAAAKQQLKQAKAERESRRLHCPTPEETAALIRESQFLKAEYKRLERRWKEEIQLLTDALHPYEQQIEALKQERRQRSADLQMRLFRQFRMLNARGEEQDLCTLFAPTAQQTPPAGAGECCAPKLLQYAYRRGWKPIAMAEFWWGDSPKTEVRHHGHYYPACKGKCEPILKHMLQGLQVEPNPLGRTANGVPEPAVIYEDRYLLVVDKPAGMLSVPGREGGLSLSEWVRRRCPEADGPLMVHRLDMDTSGLMVIAKDLQTYRHLQVQFSERRVQKTYVALLDGCPPQPSGTIDLPLCPNPLDRPRQLVSREHGKPALTHYTVISVHPDGCRVSFSPQTGRTHQLRMHAASPQGLGCPIVGDRLYGRAADRLYLDAVRLSFTHPATAEKLSFEKQPVF